MVELMRARGLPAILLPGVVHLDTVPAHRKVNRVDMGTADKVCVAALGIRDQGRRLGLPPEQTAFVLARAGRLLHGGAGRRARTDRGRDRRQRRGPRLPGARHARRRGRVRPRPREEVDPVHRRGRLRRGRARPPAGGAGSPRRPRSAGADRLGGPDRGGREAGRRAARRRAGRPRGAALRARGPRAGGRRGPRRAARRRAARPAARRLRRAREGSGAGRGADRRRPRRRAAPRCGRHDAPPRRAAAPCWTTSTWPAPTRCDATSGSRADPDRGAHDPRPRRVGRARRRRRSSPSTTSGTSIRSASARRIRCGSAGADTPPPRSWRSRASCPTRPSSTAEASRTTRTWSRSWPATECCSATSPSTLRRVRDPGALFAYLAQRGFAVPDTRLETDPLPAAGAWLVKPARGGGGQGVRPWRGQRPAPTEILQERVEGVSASAAFLADGRRSVVLGWTEQLHAPRSFRYAGNIMPLEAGAAAREEVTEIADALTEEYGLRGLNGVDFILRRDRPVVLEVNPRYCASMELVERASGDSVFALHRAACLGSLPDALAEGGRDLGEGDRLRFADRGRPGHDRVDRAGRPRRPPSGRGDPRRPPHLHGHRLGLDAARLRGRPPIRGRADPGLVRADRRFGSGRGYGGQRVETASALAQVADARGGFA